MSGRKRTHEAVNEDHGLLLELSDVVKSRFDSIATTLQENIGAALHDINTRLQQVEDMVSTVYDEQKKNSDLLQNVRAAATALDLGTADGPSGPEKEIEKIFKGFMLRNAVWTMHGPKGNKKIDAGEVVYFGKRLTPEKVMNSSDRLKQIIQTTQIKGKTGHRAVSAES